MNIKKLSLGAVLVTLLMTLLSLVSPTSSVKAETKKYVIATDITFAPFEYQDTNGEYVGIDSELMKSIAVASQIVTMTAESGWEFLKTLKSHLFLILKVKKLPLN